MEKIVLILLAAGDSRRFNGNKLLHLFDGKPMYRYLVDEIGKLPETLFEKKIVVTQYQEIMDALGEEGYLVVEITRVSWGYLTLLSWGFERRRRGGTAGSALRCATSLI